MSSSRASAVCSPSLARVSSALAWEHCASTRDASTSSWASRPAAKASVSLARSSCASSSVSCSTSASAASEASARGAAEPSSASSRIGCASSSPSSVSVRMRTTSSGAACSRAASSRRCNGDMAAKMSAAPHWARYSEMATRSARGAASAAPCSSDTSVDRSGSRYLLPTKPPILRPTAPSSHPRALNTSFAGWLSWPSPPTCHTPSSLAAPPAHPASSPAGRVWDASPSDSPPIQLTVAPPSVYGCWYVRWATAMKVMSAPSVYTTDPATKSVAPALPSVCTPAGQSAMPREPAGM
mmetsp:Transcript_36538/g.117334  ORF Transcript_36538/g.117334 Transcript_36538/m.117334 type:complete len:297 (-) Transcript_36538:95-985(-)